MKHTNDIDVPVIWPERNLRKLGTQKLKRQQAAFVGKGRIVMQRKMD